MEKKGDYFRIGRNSCEGMRSNSATKPSITLKYLDLLKTQKRILLANAITQKLVKIKITSVNTTNDPSGTLRFFLYNKKKLTRLIIFLKDFFSLIPLSFLQKRKWGIAFSSTFANLIITLKIFKEGELEFIKEGKNTS